MSCLCGSEKKYADCCGRYHSGEIPENALLLMRSRYTAYALGLLDYIIQTTHPEHPLWKKPRPEWEQDIAAFSQQTAFQGLTIHDFQEDGSTAYVTFTAHLSQNNQDTSFTERSLFKKVGGKWLYLSGEHRG